MTTDHQTNDSEFRDAVAGLLRGDFSRLDPPFADPPGGRPCRIVEWYAEGAFATEPEALAEALTCACFNGRTEAAQFLLDEGVDPEAGARTGLNAIHWAVNRGHLETVGLLLDRKVPLETKSMYGGTVLRTAIWSALHEPRPDHLAIVELLLLAGARVEATGYPTGHARVDEILLRHGADA